MAQGSYISVPDNQKGSNPEIVTKDSPLPVALDDQIASTDIRQAIIKIEMLNESIESMVVQLRICNGYLSEGFDEVLTEDDINERS